MVYDKNQNPYYSYYPWYDFATPMEKNGSGIKLSFQKKQVMPTKWDLYRDGIQTRGEAASP